MDMPGTQWGFNETSFNVHYFYYLLNNSICQDLSLIIKQGKKEISISDLVNVPGASQVALGVKNSPANAGDIRDVGLIPGSGRSPGGRHGNPLQYSCLENPMDRGAWRATVHGNAKSWTWLEWLSQHACTSTSKACQLLQEELKCKDNKTRFLSSKKCSLVQLWEKEEEKQAETGSESSISMWEVLLLPSEHTNRKEQRSVWGSESRSWRGPMERDIWAGT